MVSSIRAEQKPTQSQSCGSGWTPDPAHNSVAIADAVMLSLSDEGDGRTAVGCRFDAIAVLRKAFIVGALRPSRSAGERQPKCLRHSATS
jgi:hypothetical protein